MREVCCFVGGPVVASSCTSVSIGLLIAGQEQQDIEHGLRTKKGQCRNPRITCRTPNIVKPTAGQGKERSEGDHQKHEEGSVTDFQVTRSMNRHVHGATPSLISVPHQVQHPAAGREIGKSNDEPLNDHEPQQPAQGGQKIAATIQSARWTEQVSKDAHPQCAVACAARIARKSTSESAISHTSPAQAATFWFSCAGSILSSVSSAVWCRSK